LGLFATLSRWRTSRWEHCSAPWALSQNVRSVNPGLVESTAQRLTHALLEKGFEVNRGYFKLWEVDDCPYTFDKLGLCFGNNPAAHYVTFGVPPWPDESVIQEIRSVWTPSPPGYEDLFRLDPREAIIILAQMPPPARYFSEQSFVFTREGAYDTNAYQKLVDDANVPDFAPHIFFRTVPLPENIPQRILLFSSLSHAINNVVIEKQSEKAFDQMRHFIITPDQVMDHKVRDIFKGISVRDEDIFTEHIPSNLKIGLSRDSDDFVTLIRYARRRSARNAVIYLEKKPAACRPACQAHRSHCSTLCSLHRRTARTQDGFRRIHAPARSV
jgi:hypothetical protein